MASASIVSTLPPSTSTAKTMQAFTASPLASTVQAPHSPAEQPSLVPVSSRSSLQKTQQCPVLATSRS